MPVVRIPHNVFKRLEKHAKGFDTPTNVIERLLNAYEGKPDMKPEAEQKTALPLAKPALSFHPDEESFRSGLIKGEKAGVILIYATGEKETKSWHATRFNRDSNLRANIWSGPLRGWQEKGIVKAEFYLGE